MIGSGIMYWGQNRQHADAIQKVHQLSNGKYAGRVASTAEQADTMLAENDLIAVVIDCTVSPDPVLPFIQQVAKTHPAVLRFAIIDRDDRPAMLRLVDRVHQVLPEPLAVDRLLTQIESATGLRQVLTSQSLQERIASIESLPSLPDSYSRIVTTLRDPDVAVHKIAESISADPAITAKLLQVVNSAYFGLSRQVTSVAHAVNLVGINTIQSLVLSASVFENFRDLRIPRTSVEEIFSRSITVGSKARLLAHAFDFDPYSAENTLIGGMLHDIGRLIMARYFTHEFTDALRLSDELKMPLHDATEEVMGASDAVLGAYLLSLWGMCHPVIEAVALRYRPSLSPKPEIGPLTAVHLAWAIDNDERHNIRSESDSSLDMDYLAALGLDSQIMALRGFCSGAVA